ncbi:MAG: hypothetical protein HUU03_13270 [Planctomycetaceae bacterium]|nr:hypothetical protein [Planctomycetaceae bacterium]
MGWQIYGIGAIAVLSGALLVLAIKLMGWSAEMGVGIASGLGLGFVLLVLGYFGTRRALREKDMKAAMSHALGGFFFRLVTLVAGVFALVYTGWANPLGFALSYLVMVFAFLALEVVMVQNALDRSKEDAAQPR